MIPTHSSTRIIYHHSATEDWIPDDVWVNVFRAFASNQDLSTVFFLRRVSKRWYNCLPNSLTEATIRYGPSLKLVSTLCSLNSLVIKTRVQINYNFIENIFTNLQSLSLQAKDIECFVPPEVWTRMTKLTSLDLFDQSKSFSYPSPMINQDNIKLLTNLRSLKIRGDDCTSLINFENLSNFVHLTELNNWEDNNISRAVFMKRYGLFYQILDHFKELKVARLQIFRSTIDCAEIQKKYPHVRFIWAKKENCVVRYYYEGEFLPSNIFHGKGSVQFPKGIYSGNFDNGKAEGKGIFAYASGNVYEGDFKNGHLEGKGLYIFKDGKRYEGDFKNDKRDGNGVMIYPDGSKHIGEWKNDKREGEGFVEYIDGRKFEGEWKDVVD